MFMRIFITRQLTAEPLSKIRIRKTHETSIVVFLFSCNSVLQLNDNFNYCIIFERMPANIHMGVRVISRFLELLTMSIIVTVEFDFRCPLMSCT